MCIFTGAIKIVLSTFRAALFCHLNLAGRNPSQIYSPGCCSYTFKHLRQGWLKSLKKLKRCLSHNTLHLKRALTLLKVVCVTKAMFEQVLFLHGIFKAKSDGIEALHVLALVMVLVRSLLLTFVLGKLEVWTLKWFSAVCLQYMLECPIRIWTCFFPECTQCFKLCSTVVYREGRRIIVWMS